MEAHDDGTDSSVEIEIRGLSIYTHHGVTDAEREIGQRLEIDVSFDVPDCDAVLTDRLEDTVDYSEVCDIVALGAKCKLERPAEVRVRRNEEKARHILAKLDGRDGRLGTLGHGRPPEFAVDQSVNRASCRRRGRYP